MSRKLFGTDGIRGLANQVLTPELAFQLGTASGRWLRRRGGPYRVVMGRDTRRSGAMLGAALASGFCAVGVDVVSLGVAPTGAISWVARMGEYGLAAVISASHNPAPDNGIKLIAHDGRKLSEKDESEVESLLGEPLTDRSVGAEVGQIHADRTELEGYLKWLEGLLPERLDGVLVAVDGAHGAGFELGPEVLRRLGAQVLTIGVEPDGVNINAEGGATKPAAIQCLTKSSGALLGVAFDGDADRAVFSDENGVLINGDRTMAMWCAHWSRGGLLNPPVVVGTVMSNGGFEQYMRSCGVDLVRAQVGDKYVFERMASLGAVIGGEQSGHIIYNQRGPTGDGLVTALETLRVLVRERSKASDHTQAFHNWPQLLVNVQVDRKEGWESNPEVKSSLDWAANQLVGNGRISVRASGTQPIVRVMVEADREELCHKVCNQVVETLLRVCGGTVYSRVDLTNALGD